MVTCRETVGALWQIAESNVVFLKRIDTAVVCLQIRQ